MKSGHDAHCHIHHDIADCDRLCRMAWRRPRTGDGSDSPNNSHLRPAASRICAGGISCAGYWSLNDRHIWRSIDNHSGAYGISVLADDNRCAAHFTTASALQSHNRHVHASHCLSDNASGGILASSAHSDPRNLATSKTAKKQRQRSVLADLIATIEPHESREIANALLNEFGSLAKIWAQTPEALERVLGTHHAVTRLLIHARAALIEGMQTELIGTHIDLSDPKLTQYLMASMGGLPDEAFRVLFLDANNRLIADEQLQYGALTQLALYPRTIFRRAMEHNAAGLILVHNHPSGDPTPSANDISVTHMLANIGRSLEIEIIDHIIVTNLHWRCVPNECAQPDNKLQTSLIVSPLSDVKFKGKALCQTEAKERLSQLSEKHIEVLIGVSDLKSSKEIARDLKISPHTVNQRVQKIVAVLGTQSRIEAGKLYRKVRETISANSVW